MCLVVFMKGSSDKIGGFTMLILGLLLTIFTLIDSLDGNFRYASKTQGVYQAVLENGAYDFYVSLMIQTSIGIGVACLGAYIIRLSKR